MIGGELNYNIKEIGMKKTLLTLAVALLAPIALVQAEEGTHTNITGADVTRNNDGLVDNADHTNAAGVHTANSDAVTVQKSKKVKKHKGGHKAKAKGARKAKKTPPPATEQTMPEGASEAPPSGQ